MGMNKYPVMGESHAQVVIAGSFALNDTNTDPGTVRGTGFTVAYTSCGKYTITFNGGNKYNQLDSATATLQSASVNDKNLQFGAYTAPTASADGTLVLNVVDASTGAVAELPANANTRANFFCVFRDSGVA